MTESNNNIPDSDQYPSAKHSSAKHDKKQPDATKEALSVSVTHHLKADKGPKMMKQEDEEEDDYEEDD